MDLYLTKDVRNVESHIIDDLGVSSLVLMEHAAYRVYEEIVKRFDIKKESFLFAVGKGNNGGDAYTLARMILVNGGNVQIFEVFGEPQTADTLIEKELLKTAFPDLSFITVDHLEENVKDSILVDGIFGIGFKGELSRDLANIFDKLNKAKYIISIDVPSGMESDFGRLAKNAICADLTVTFFLNKQGLHLYPAFMNVGELVVKNLSFPVAKDLTPSSKLIDKEYIRSLLAKIYPRKQDAHKGNFGKLGIISAAKGMEGATSICSIGALKAGAGLVSVITVDRDLAELRSSIPSLPVDIVVDDTELNDLYEKYDLIVIGPGFSKSRKSTLTKVIDFALKYKKKIIFDADALNIASLNPELLSKMRQANAIFTPHPKEMASLAQKTIQMVQSNRLQVVKDFVEGSNITLVLKGAGTIIVDDQLNTYISPFSSPALSTGGTGDFLTGIIAGFVSQGLAFKEASILGVYLHALAGKLYSKKHPDFTMTIDKLEKYFVKAIKKTL